MSHARRAMYLAVGLVLAAALGACGNSSSGGGATVGTTPTTTPVAGHTVTIQGFAFHPSTLTVSPGTKVTFVMEDSGVQHNVTGSGTSAFLASPDLSKGQSYTVTFTKPGTYRYICTIHPNMKGEVIVQ